MLRFFSAWAVLVASISTAVGCFEHHPVESFEPIDASRDAFRDARDADLRDVTIRDSRIVDVFTPTDARDTLPIDVGPPDVPLDVPRDVPPDVPPDVPRDVPPPVDARCDFVPMGEFGGLTCPDFAVAGGVQITVTASPGRCCDTGTAMFTVTPTADLEWEIVGEWEVCDCCAGCGCLSPHVVRIVRIDMTPGIHIVRAGTRSCRITVSP